MAAVAAALARAVRVRARMVDLRVLPFLALAVFLLLADFFLAVLADFLLEVVLAGAFLAEAFLACWDLQAADLALVLHGSALAACAA
ncbi:hypothetical protein BN115_1393 [Bordetella bronchiseptica MO149]|nr:hypothetical protein BN115_1393 [Bordetella bronchiseptica MO149]CCN04797.1 hypothetical protein BN116_3005 [Bordetella bronchiseptica Bbr77]